MPIEQVDGDGNGLKVVEHTPNELEMFQKIRKQIEVIYTQNAEIRSSSDSKE